jgi:hypothetical protein
LALVAVESARQNKELNYYNYYCYYYCYYYYYYYSDANKLDRVPRKFLALYYDCFFPQIHYSYENALEHLNLHTLINRRRHLDELFLVNVYNGYTFCPSSTETVGNRAPSPNFRDFCLLLVLHIKIVPSLDVHQPKILCNWILSARENVGNYL